MLKDSVRKRSYSDRFGKCRFNKEQRVAHEYLTLNAGL